MFKKFLSQIGIGNASINLHLDRDVVAMGERIDGKLVVEGGSVEQEINGITVYLQLKSSYVRDDATQHVKLNVSSVNASGPFRIGAGERKELPFSMDIPNYIPFSSVNTKYFFSTNLDIDSGVDSSDVDYVTVLPSGLMKNFIEGFHLLGCHVRAEGFTGRTQLLDFRTTSWLAGKLDELVFHFDPAQSHSVISGHFEIDKRTSGLFGSIMDELDLDEKKGYYAFHPEDLRTPEVAAQTIRRFVEGHYRHLEG